MFFCHLSTCGRRRSQFPPTCSSWFAVFGAGIALFFPFLFFDLQQSQVAHLTKVCRLFLGFAQFLCDFPSIIFPFFDLRRLQVGARIELQRSSIRPTCVADRLIVTSRLPQVDNRDKLEIVPGLIVTMWRAAARGFSTVVPVSCQSHESLLQCGACATYFAVLGVKITCFVYYDRADDSSIYRGTYHILESKSSTTRSAAVPIALPWTLPQGRGKMSCLCQRTLF